MWKRATWHDCANELDEVCQRFRNAYWGRRHGSRWPRHPDDEAMMLDTSKEGVQILRALAVAVRSEQDFAMVPKGVACVGALKERDGAPSDATQAKQKCGYLGLLKLEGYHPLWLRQALNKIVHANPQQADYYIGPGDSDHELLLWGTDRSNSWFAAISLIELAKAVRALPDAAICGDVAL